MTFFKIVFLHIITKHFWPVSFLRHFSVVGRKAAGMMGDPKKRIVYVPG